MSDTFVFRFTIEQVNNMLDLMSRGEYGRVQAVINEFQRQIKAQQEPPQPPKENGKAQADSAGDSHANH